MTKRFKFKAPKTITHEQLSAELILMGYDQDDLSLLFSQAASDGEYSTYDIEDATAEIATAKQRVLRRLEDAAFDAFWKQQGA